MRKARLWKAAGRRGNEEIFPMVHRTTTGGPPQLPERTTQNCGEVVAENIPTEMKTYPAWVCWRFEERGGKRTKIPYVAGGNRKASSTDSRTWRTFMQALEAYKGGAYDGIGFVLSSG